MIDAFHISASSMDAHQVYVDVIANNLANANTSGFKKSSVEFSDLIYSELRTTASTMLTAHLESPIGKGTSVSAIQKVFSQGAMRSTGRNLDIAIQGSGFLEVLMPDGSYGYTRTGHLRVDKDGQLVTADGNAVSPSVSIPVDTTEILITPTGEVQVQVPKQKEPINAGFIELASFVNPGGLDPLGGNMYAVSEASGSAFYGAPGEEQLGVLAQGFLEGSNVDLIEELSGLMLAQRGYEMNAKVLQAADEMLGIVNSLRR